MQLVFISNVVKIYLRKKLKKKPKQMDSCEIPVCSSRATNKFDQCHRKPERTNERKNERTHLLIGNWVSRNSSF